MLTTIKINILNLLKSVFFRNRLDSHGKAYIPKGVDKIICNVNQYIIESSLTPPWVWDAKACHRFWGLDVNNKADPNAPTGYYNKPKALIKFLEQFWSPYIKKDFSILELGCNCGTNLNLLHTERYTDLSGIDINADAVNLMNSVYPELYENATICVGKFEDLLSEIESKSFDVIFTMAVLMHIHPTSTQVFSNMARIARKYIVVVEQEYGNCEYVFSRNYKRVFSRVGCKQVKKIMLGVDDTPDYAYEYHGMKARIFEV